MMLDRPKFSQASRPATPRHAPLALALLALAMVPGLAGCNLTGDPSAQAAAIDSDPLPDTVSVDLYKPDGACKGLVAQSVKVPRDRPLEAAVGRLLIEATGDKPDPAFDLRHYRISLDTAKRAVTIDLRLNPDGRRKFQSLSSCEQLTLFGSLQATLTRNRLWPVDRVYFTDGDRPLSL
ncbi:hypothetical protein H6F46_01625 [Limnothrix sp. FACHB-1083]|uniref:hypothetical protein n=1 Tax=unclassified Limnothrix TaxID=2632864 RepID=UPI00168096F3|nr:MULTISPECIES: hypothetical protein [unclassified Limnothrix]MBD2159385.1 hypothetical protein [Limnothrix sp. FACHB-1083]MBD2193118.1 hypothetical protein [Limnothrix sp. FACHB-1088]